jgi:uncharacterized protein (TIGR00299 family) protein
VTVLQRRLKDAATSPPRLTRLREPQLEGLVQGHDRTGPRLKDSRVDETLEVAYSANHMARILYLEPVGGIAGDMFLASALDLGVPLGELEAPLRTLDVGGWKFAVSRAKRHSIEGTHLDVEVDHHPDHHHTPLSEIRALIKASQLSPRARDRALALFETVGRAEAKIHGTTLEQVEFHEVGAVDSIVDICGAAVVLELLGEPEVYALAPPLGSGQQKTAHGSIPIPVPATVEILRDVPVRYEGVGELTTPTGAALVKVLAKVQAPPPLKVEKVGYGVGTKDFPDRANVLRASLGHSVEASDGLHVLECNLDDATPQLIGVLVERLLAQGALDAWVLPATMKKGRPGHLLGALVASAGLKPLTQLLLAESTSLGVRSYEVQRTALQRRFEEVETPYGRVKMKIGYDTERVLNVAPELEDAKALAEKLGVPLKLVLAAAVAAFKR